MRVALAQINPVLGDFTGNSDKIIRAAESAYRQGAEIAVFPEMALCGYPPRDLLEKPAFLDAQDRALDRLKRKLKGFPIILGYVTRRYDGGATQRYNSVGLLFDDEARAVGRKSVLPEYDLFNEARYFEAGESPVCVELLGLRWGLSLSDEAWNDKDFWRRSTYARDPIEALANQDADVIVNIAASPFHLDKQTHKETMLSSLARKHRRPVIYVNLVGGNDELIFDGRSIALDPQGKLLARAPAFRPSITVVDIESLTEGAIEPRLSDDEELRQALVLGMHDYGEKCGFDGAVLGLSGGIDSALLASLAVEAFEPQNVTALALPAPHSSEEGLEDAKALAAKLKLRFEILPLEKSLNAILETLTPHFAGKMPDVTEENVQPRLRALMLMAFSNKFGSLLLTGGNKSELATGYATLYGDMCSGLAALSDLYKTSVYRLARHLNSDQPEPLIPGRALHRPPSPELRPNQTDEEVLPPYHILDAILKEYLEGQHSVEQIVALGYDAATVRKVVRLVDHSEYKRRQAAPGLRITARSWGSARWMPIAHRFREGE
jgi:NAD+ synthase/NAD+ synthase (glutamine-hydrolysing)